MTSTAEGGGNNNVHMYSTLDREYDPDLHCGVIIEDIGKPCTRPLACKVRQLNPHMQAWHGLLYLLYFDHFLLYFGVVGILLYLRILASDEPKNSKNE